MVEKYHKHHINNKMTLKIINFQYLEHHIDTNTLENECTTVLKTAQIQWNVGESAAELFRRNRKLFEHDNLFDKLPDNIDDPVQWFEFRRQLINVKTRVLIDDAYQCVECVD